MPLPLPPSRAQGAENRRSAPARPSPTAASIKGVLLLCAACFLAWRWLRRRQVKARWQPELWEPWQRVLWETLLWKEPSDSGRV